MSDNVDTTGIEAARRISAAAWDYTLDNRPGGDDPVIRLASPDELRAMFADVAPLDFPDVVEPLTADAVTAACELVVRQSVQTIHPRFMNQNFAGPDVVSVAGDWLGSALNTTNATFEAAPVFTMIEDAVLHKLAAVAGFPDMHDRLPPGMFAPGGSSGALYALQLARHRRWPDAVRTGMAGEKPVLFVSGIGHYSATKCAALLGIGTDAVIMVDADADGAMRPDALVAAVAAARADGRHPFAVIATAGTTVTSAFDPIGAIADVCDAEDLWLHVDGCYGGSALFSPAQRHRLDGVHRADSFVWNLHKMMGMTQQCTAVLLADPEQLGPCFATQADYLFQPDKLHAEFDSGDRHFQCARRVDALKLWLSWHVRGDAGFANRIDHAVAMADHARQLLADRSDEFETVIAGDFTNVIFRWLPPSQRGGDRDDAVIHGVSPAIKAAMQQQGAAMIGFQPIEELNAFRLIVMSATVSTNDIDAVFDTVARIGAELNL